MWQCDTFITRATVRVVCRYLQWSTESDSFYAQRIYYLCHTTALVSRNIWHFLKVFWRYYRCNSCGRSAERGIAHVLFSGWWCSSLDAQCGDVYGGWILQSLSSLHSSTCYFIRSTWYLLNYHVTYSSRLCAVILYEVETKKHSPPPRVSFDHFYIHPGTAMHLSQTEEGEWLCVVIFSFHDAMSTVRTIHHDEWVDDRLSRGGSTDGPMAWSKPIVMLPRTFQQCSREVRPLHSVSIGETNCPNGADSWVTQRIAFDMCVRIIYITVICLSVALTFWLGWEDISW